MLFIVFSILQIKVDPLTKFIYSVSPLTLDQFLLKLRMYKAPTRLTLIKPFC